MEIKLDNFDTPTEIQIAAETQKDAYDLGALRTALALRGIQFEEDDSPVLLSFPLQKMTEPAD